MAIQRMDNVLIVVDDLEAVKSFFTELGLELVGETQVEGPLVDSVIALKDVRATLALMRTPDGHCGIELDKFHTPTAIRFGPVDAPVNTLGIRRIMFAVKDIDPRVPAYAGFDQGNNPPMCTLAQFAGVPSAAMSSSPLRTCGLTNARSGAYDSANVGFRGFQATSLTIGSAV